MQNISTKLATSGAALIVALAAHDASAQTPVYNWTGFYVGAHGGYGWGDVNLSGGDKIKSTKGWVGGLQAGYNWQLSSIVIGSEIDASLSGVKGEEFFSNKDISMHQRWSGTARLKAGLPINGMPGVGGILLYGTGGLAVSQWKDKVEFTGGEVDKASATHFGWTAGAGMEVALSPSVSMKLEYLYADYGNKKYDGEKRDPRLSTLRLGVNYRFSTVAP